MSIEQFSRPAGRMHPEGYIIGSPHDPNVQRGGIHSHNAIDDDGTIRPVYDFPQASQPSLSSNELLTAILMGRLLPQPAPTAGDIASPSIAEQPAESVDSQPTREKVPGTIREQDPEDTIEEPVPPEKSYRPRLMRRFLGGFILTTAVGVWGGNYVSNTVWNQGEDESPIEYFQENAPVILEKSGTLFISGVQAADRSEQ